VPSIINGLFAGRSGIISHGMAISVSGDNISNANTIGFKTSRASFEDIMAGEGILGKQVGSGSQIGAVQTMFEQGTLEFTGRPLDLGISGNGFFVLANGLDRSYSRAGDFKIDAAGFITNQNGLAVLGFPTNGSGALQPINVNNIEQSSIATNEVNISGNVNSATPLVDVNDIPDPGPTIPPVVTYADLNKFAEYSTVVDVFDSLGQNHAVSLMFYHTGANEFTVRAYVNNDEVDPTASLTVSGYPRFVGETVITFGGNGQRNPAFSPAVPDLTMTIDWNNGSDQSITDLNFNPMTQYAAASNILSVSQDGKGIGSVSSITVGGDGKVSALLTNGQTSVIGSIALANFSNPEGLLRLGRNQLGVSVASGDPLYGKPTAGTFGAIKAGTVELSTVDIASEFVRIITLQRGFQASSRIITTINQLLNDVIQLA
jgi:flagellar hook protein FlgE